MPSASDVHVDSALSSFASAYENGALVADTVCPIIEVTKRSDKYFTYTRKDASTIRDDRIGPNAHANQSSYEVSTSNFSVEDRALVDFVSQDVIDNADAPLEPLQDATDNIMLRLMLGREDRVATLLQTSSNYASSNTSAAANVWSDETNGTPLADLQTMIEAIPPGNPGNSKLVLILALEAWHALRKHPDMRGGGALRPVVSLQEAADLAGVDEILVSNAMKNTANEGQPASYSRIWSKTSAVMVRVPTGQPRGKTNLFAGTFRFRPSGQEGVQVRRWAEPARGPRGSEAVQVSYSDDEVVIQNDMGYLLTSILI